MGKWLDRLAATAEKKLPPPFTKPLTKLTEGGRGAAHRAFVSFGSARPKGLREFSMPLDRVASPDTREAFEERAAIREFDGGQTRSEAERVAWCEVACRHYRRRPPDGLGCCAGGRDDLIPVYGPGHPLRHVPDDLGDSCQLFEQEG